MTNLLDDAGNIVKELTGEEVLRVRSGIEYDKAVILIVTKWRKAVLGLAGVVSALSVVGAALVWMVKMAGKS